MSQRSLTETIGPSARKLPVAGTKNDCVFWEGRRVALLWERGMWRLRCRAKGLQVDMHLGSMPRAEAKKEARRRLEGRVPVEVTRGTLERGVELYKMAPKRCNGDSAAGNIARLRSTVRGAWGLELGAVEVGRLPDLWPAFVAARQGRVVPDYATRRRENHGINSAMRQAASVFIKSLRPFYKRNGFIVPEDAINILWLPETPLVPAVAMDGEMVAAWRELRKKDVELWAVVGLARFAGLRQSEIFHLRGKWIVQQGSATYVFLKDREEDDYQHKTGNAYLALILEPELAEWLLALPAESGVLSRTDPARWIQRAPQAWLRPFTGTAKAPLHRLRGLYADHVRRETEAAILARQAALKAASKALGHTSTATTEAHYVTPDGLGGDPALQPKKRGLRGNRSRG